jgi:endonuclease/exonuclease/phosphatase family metal-dependent hydrolase
MLKIIQLNVFKFTYFDKLLEFLKEQNADIINIQEATTSEITDFCNGKYLDQLANELGMQVIYAPFTAMQSQDGKLDWFGNAILTKLEVLDFGTVWFRNSDNKPGIISYESMQKLEEAIRTNRNLAYPIVYREPKNLIWMLLKYNGKIFRNITTHFTATQKCTETLQMIQEAENVCDFVNSTKNVPTIFSGDLNIHQKASCIQNLKSNLNLVNIDSTNTLAPSNHPIFLPKYQQMDPSISNGLSVDYVFQKGFEVIKWDIPEVAISDHLPIVVELEMPTNSTDNM